MNNSILKIIFTLLCLSQITFSQSSLDKSIAEDDAKWKKHLDLVNIDIATINKVASKDTSIYVRLLELYGELLDLYIERENFLLITTPEKAQGEVKQLANFKAKVYVDLLKLSDSLLSRVKSPQIKAKIYYYKAENSYNLKKYKEFYSYIKTAEKLSTEPRMTRRIYQKVSDYYFNNQKFEKCIFYYEYLIKDTSDKWTSKYKYNLGWAYLKQNAFEKSIDSFKSSLAVSKQPGFFNIGEQAINSLMFAFVLSSRELEGYDFLRQEGLINFTRSVAYLDLVFEHGKKETAVTILDYAKKEIKTYEDLNQFITSFIIVNRNLKRFKSIDDYLKEIFNHILLKDKIILKDTVVNLRSYSGYLQELLRNKTYLNTSLRSALVDYSVAAFSFLKKYDPDNSLEYIFFQGEVNLSQENHQRALDFYREAIGLMANPKLFKVADEYTEKIFQSIFKVIELLNNPIESLVYVYTNYIKYGKNGELKISVYERYLNYLMPVDDKKFVETLREYNLKYPSERENQVKYYKLYVNTLIKKAEPDLILSLYNEAKGGLLKLEKVEIDKLLELFKNLILKSIDSPTKQMSYLEKIKLLNNLQDKYAVNSTVTNEIFLRYFKVAYDDYEIQDFIVYLNKYKEFLEKNPSHRNLKLLSSYTNILCDYDYHIECLVNIVYLTKNYSFKKLERRLKEMYFFQHLRISKVENAYYAGIVIKDEFPEFDFLNPVLRSLALMDADRVFKFLQDKRVRFDTKDLVLDMIEDHLIYKYVRSQSDAKFLDLCLKINPEKCQKFKKLVTSMNDLKKFKMAPVKKFNNKEEVTFETFSIDLNENMKIIAQQTELLEKLIKGLDPRVQSLGFFKGMEFYAIARDLFSSFIPNTKDVELSKAIVGEMKNLSSVFSAKIEEYEKSSKKIRAKISDDSGVSLLGLPLSNREDVSNEAGRYIFMQDGI